MAKTPSSNAETSSKAKQQKRRPHRPIARNRTRRPVRTKIASAKRAYGIWIAEGRPHGRELAHWQRAHHELQREAR